MKFMGAHSIFFFGLLLGLSIFPLVLHSEAAESRSIGSETHDFTLVSIKTPAQVNAKERFQLEINYMSSLQPNEIKKLTKNIYVNFGGGCPAFQSKIDAIQKSESINVYERKITIDNFYFGKPRNGCILEIFIEYGDSLKTNTVISDSVIVK